MVEDWKEQINIENRVEKLFGEDGRPVDEGFVLL